MKCSADAASTAPRIVVLGGGFGGLYTALRLASLPWPRECKPEVSKRRACDTRPSLPALQVTLVDRSARFVFKPLLYELLTGQLDESQVRALQAEACRLPAAPHACAPR